MKMSTEDFKPIPQVAGYPVIGTLEPKRYDLLTLVRRQYARLGPVFRISSFNRTSVVLAGPEANRLMRTEGHRLFTSVPAWVELNRAFGGDNPVLLSMDPPDHGKIRSALKPGYAGSALYPRMGQLLESQLHLIQAWPMDMPISVFPHMKRLVCLLLGYLATNEDPGEVLDDIIFGTYIPDYAVGIPGSRITGVPYGIAPPRAAAPVPRAGTGTDGSPARTKMLMAAL
ncbi:MAG: hypothetical protein OXC13_17150 [Caldilineaceae bacterium]|nr:hypothetical protein [Caldilineaceae bacterium]